MALSRNVVSAAAAARSIRRWLSHRASLRISPLLLMLIVAAAASVGSIVTWARAPQQAAGVAPADFDRGNIESLADFLATLCTQSFSASFPAEAPFLGGNALAMSKMMNGMAITPSGDTDTDFVHMMVPHHQGAIDMAVLEIRYGKNSTLKRLAQEIVVDQQQEIAAMDLAVHEPLPAAMPAPTGSSVPLSPVERLTEQ